MVLKVSKLNKIYKQGKNSILHVLKDLDFNINKNEKIAIMGASGSGKSTFLHCISGLDTYDSGQVIFEENNISNFTEDELSIHRNKNIGFVFQFHYVLKEFNVLDNILMPASIASLNSNVYRDYALFLLEKLELINKVKSMPNELSGGELQRVAIARALIMKPKLLLMDEPTGNLDEALSKKVMNYILDLSQNFTCIIATHNEGLAKMFDRVLFLKNGVLL